VVHHVTVYFKPPWLDWDLQLGGRINMLGGYSPGKRPVNVPGWDGMARFVPAGSKLMFEMHYTPNGTAQSDRSSIAIVFVEPEQVKRQLSVVVIADTTFEIPPHAEAHQVEASYTFDEDSLLYAFSPHMHLRGDKFRYVATYPDGTTEILLDVPHFDFNWQLDYMLAEPKRIPEGTRIDCTASFDNSEQNLANPDPTDTVRWGDQTWQEMMIGALAIAPANQNIAAMQGGGGKIHGSYRVLWGMTLLAGALAIALAVAILLAWRKAWAHQS